MLYIAEKYEVAKAIIDALGGGKKLEGYFRCGNDTVTWCKGHMLQLCEPEDYDAGLHRWKLADLPLFFFPYRKKPIPENEEQLKVILHLLKHTRTVVHGGDPDSEGQLLVDELLRYADFTGDVKRLLINDTNPAVVQKAMANLQNNDTFRGISEAAEARQLADFHYGINMTRLYTLLAKKEGYSGIVNVGRVMTAIQGLVVRRDQAFGTHKKTPFYLVRGSFRFGEVETTATCNATASSGEEEDSDHFPDEALALRVTQETPNLRAEITSITVTTTTVPPPLPYTLLALQADASRQFGYLPDHVKAVTQTLREKSRLITYNRSDCPFLSDEQHRDAAKVIGIVGENIPELKAMADAANPERKGRAFDSSKVTSHHGIVPTQATVDYASLTVPEQRIYRLIAARYLMQFLLDYVYESRTIQIQVGEYTFTKTEKRTIHLGWKAFAGNDDDPPEPPPASSAALEKGQTGTCLAAFSEQRFTTPPPRYTVSSLLGNLTDVTGELHDESLRSAQKNAQVDAAQKGIGTASTRDEIIRHLIEIGYLEVQSRGKMQLLVSTKLGREIYAILPDVARYPDSTARLRAQLARIERGDLTLEQFIEEWFKEIANEVSRVIDEGLHLGLEKYTCPACGWSLVQRQTAGTVFWGCNNYPNCRATFPDEGGKPGIHSVMPDDPGVACPECGKPMKFRTGRKGPFLGCSGFPRCKRTMPITRTTEKPHPKLDTPER